jgi:UDP-N-acetylglucosamine--dolichyl-phosphate N-acetylglucosaminephosphotransferase
MAPHLKPTDLSRSEMLGLFSLFLACFAVVANAFQGDGNPLVASLAFSGIAYSASYAMIRWLGPTMMKAGLKGKDMGRSGQPELYAYPTDSSSDSSYAS